MDFDYFRCIFTHQGLSKLVSFIIYLFIIKKYVNPPTKTPESVTLLWEKFEESNCCFVCGLTFFFHNVNIYSENLFNIMILTFCILLSFSQMKPAESGTVNPFAAIVNDVRLVIFSDA
jgi:hypothetical protein